MKFIKKYKLFVKENSSPSVKPGIKEPPVKPVKPERKDRRIDEPKKKPGPKALKKLSEEVAYTFIAEMTKKGESVKKYLN